MEKGPVLKAGLWCLFGCVTGGGFWGWIHSWAGELGEKSFTLDVPAHSNPAAVVGRQFPFPFPSLGKATGASLGLP